MAATFCCNLELGALMRFAAAMAAPSPDGTPPPAPITIVGTTPLMRTDACREGSLWLAARLRGARGEPAAWGRMEGLPGAVNVGVAVEVRGGVAPSEWLPPGKLSILL